MAGRRSSDPKAKAAAKADSARGAPGKRAPTWRRRLFWFSLKWGAVGSIWAAFAVVLFLGWCAYDLPDVSSLNDVKRRPSITLLAADGSMITSYGDLYGAFVHLDQMSPYLPAAVLATEDRRFYHHYGV